MTAKEDKRTNIFISHAAADTRLAQLVATALQASDPPLDAFVASRPGDIRADAEWLPAIEAALLRGDRFFIILTPNSINRPWVSFETGATWFSGQSFVLARTSDLSQEEIPLPLAARQIYRLDQKDEAVVIFHTLGTKLSDPDQFATDVRELLPLVRFAGETEHAWEGIVFDGNYFAWAGPLLGLEDRDPVPCPPGLDEQLRSRGLRVRFGRPDRLDHHIGRGRAQVFATDRKSWRRVVESQGQVLLVGGADVANSD